MEDRKFDSYGRGDRVARAFPFERKSHSAADLSEAMDYAVYRARMTGRRQTLRRHANHGWWLVLVNEEKILSSVKAG